MSKGMLPIIIAVLFGATTSVGAAEQRRTCDQELTQVLGDVGLTAADIHSQVWQQERSNDGVVRLRFSGQPYACDRGHLLVLFTPECSTFDAHTTGACRVEGLDRQ